MNNDYKSDVIEYTPLQQKLGKIVSVTYTVLLLVFLALVVAEVIPVALNQVLTGAILSCLGLCLLTSGLIQKNSVSIYLAFPFLVPAVVSFLCKLGVAEYSQLYPLYIAIPAIASLITALVCGSWKSHVKVIIVFAVAALIYLFSVLNLVKITVSVIASIVWALAVVAYIIYKITRSTKTNE